MDQIKITVLFPVSFHFIMIYKIQLTTNDNFILLTSSFDTNCFYGNSSSYSIDDIASKAIESYEIYHLTEEKNDGTIYNKDILDTNWSFNKSITFNGKNALILPIGIRTNLYLKYNQNNHLQCTKSYFIFIL